ncbi:MAG: LTA synthase family protein, partial [Prevotella sp.]|nr:LTA synthase family protein [Prevotella sp.]
MKHFRLLFPLVAVLVNLAIAYVVYFVARVTFLAENWNTFASNLSWSHCFELLKGGLVFDTTAILYTNALWVVMMLLPVSRKENPTYQNVCRWLFLVVNTLAFVINLADSVYFQYTMRRTTTTVFNEFSEENNLGNIFLQEALHHWYFFLLTAVVVYGMAKFYAQPRLNYRQIDARRYAVVTSLSLLALVPFCIAGMRGGWTRDTRPITISNANNYCDRPTEAGIVLNTPFSLIRTIGKNLFEVPDYFADAQDLEEVYTPVHHPTPQQPSPTIPKNVVVIILESFSKEYIGAFNRHLEGGNYKGYTPFVDSLIQHSLTFRHSYGNGRKSIDAMPSILSSIPMFVEPFFLSPYSNNAVSGLADCLNGKGYETAFFHGAERGSMGFMAFARATKFQKYFGREDFVADQRTQGDKAYDGWWGISDEPFLQYMNLKLSETQQPFMATVFTLSSHHPFRVPEPYKDAFKEEEMPIHKVIRYADHALRKFFASARRESWFQNTIFIITADHTNMSNYAEYKTDLGGFCVPIIFYDPSGEMGIGMQDAIAQQTDIMP